MALNTLPAGAFADSAITSSKINLANTFAFTGTVSGTPYDASHFHVRQESTSGTQGGNATSGSWEVRTLNTVVTNQINGSLSSNQFTIPAGTYQIYASAPAQDVLAHRIKLYNVTDTSDVLFGTNCYVDGGNDGNTSFISGRFTIASSKAFEIRHRVNRTNNTFGHGVANGFAVEIYTDVQLWKVA
tara:strand:- start:82 stop:639 length:558 start_codon:yes stop_codon:yes gene_type:complete